MFEYISQLVKDSVKVGDRMFKNDNNLIFVPPPLSVVPGVGLTPTEKPDRDHMSRALAAATKSTASVGKFTPELSKERKHSKTQGKKRKVGHGAASASVVQYTCNSSSKMSVEGELA